MASKQTCFYWDSCVFLAYVNEEPDRVTIIEDLWNEISHPQEKSEEVRIVTASISLVEVAFAAHEKGQGSLSPDVLTKIDAMWKDPSVLVVEITTPAVMRARKLMREAIPAGLRLKPYDAVHLATAMWVNENARAVKEFHTYDVDLHKFQALTGLTICQPDVLQPSLPLDEAS